MKRLFVLILTFTLLLSTGLLAVSADETVVRALLFYSPTCGHCHKVITQDLPPLYELYGGVDNVQTYTSVPADEEEQEKEDSYGPELVWIRGAQLEVLYVNVAWPIGQDLYTQTGEMYDVPDGVPRLVVGDTALVGSVDIPGQFPGIIELGLQEGGIDWPDLDGLEDALEDLEFVEVEPPPEETQDTEQNGNPENTETAEQSPPSDNAGENQGDNQGSGDPQESAFDVFDPRELTVMERIQRDLAGNLLSIAVLLGLVAASIQTGFSLRGKSVQPEAVWKRWAIPVLSVIGLGVAGYLSFIETTGTEAVCGPVGDCNTVNQSEYAMLFGFLPVAVLGLLGYIGILTAWAVYMIGRGPLADAARVAVFLMAAFGTLFSIYLTFLEPFVIAATCAWCLTSAVLIAAIMLISREPAKASWARLMNR